MQFIHQATLFWFNKISGGENGEEKKEEISPVSPEEVKSALTEIKSWLARYELNYERWKTPTEL